MIGSVTAPGFSHVALVKVKRINIRPVRQVERNWVVDFLAFCRSTFSGREARSNHQ